VELLQTPCVGEQAVDEVVHVAVFEDASAAVGIVEVVLVVHAVVSVCFWVLIACTVVVESVLS